MNCQIGINVQSQCSTKNPINERDYPPDHHEKVQSGDFFPYGVFNNQTIYQKSEKDYKGNYWFLFKNDTVDAWNLAVQTFNESFLGQEKVDVDDSVKGKNV